MQVIKTISITAETVLTMVFDPSYPDYLANKIQYNGSDIDEVFSQLKIQTDNTEPVYVCIDEDIADIDILPENDGVLKIFSLTDNTMSKSNFIRKVRFYSLVNQSIQIILE